MLTFNFRKIGLWEKDAREFLNMHESAIYFLLPAMKNADATLLWLAIEDLAQRPIPTVAYDQVAVCFSCPGG